MLKGGSLRGFALRGLLRVVAGVGVCAAMLVGSAAAQAAPGSKGNTICTAQLTNETVATNITVPQGATCILLGDTVEGNVSVGRGADIEVALTHIAGNLTIEGADSVFLTSLQVDRNTSIDSTSSADNALADFECNGVGLSVCVAGNNQFGSRSGKPGNVIITNTSPGGVVLARNTVEHNLICSGNSSITNEFFGFPNPNNVLGKEVGQCAGL